MIESDDGSTCVTCTFCWRWQNPAACVTRQHPRVVLQLIPEDSVTLVKRELRQRTIDFAIGPIFRLKPDEDVGADILFDDQFVVIAGAESKWVRRRKLRLADLIDEPWVLPPTDSVPGTSIAQTFRAAGLESPGAQMISFSFAVALSSLVDRALSHDAPTLDAAIW
jgi:DNA-binding transcriptional LysR family regulator